MEHRDSKLDQHVSSSGRVLSICCFLGAPRDSTFDPETGSASAAARQPKPRFWETMELGGNGRWVGGCGGLTKNLKKPVACLKELCWLDV